MASNNYLLKRCEMDIEEARKIIDYCSKAVKPSQQLQDGEVQIPSVEDIKKKVEDCKPPFKETDKLRFQLFNDPIHGSIKLNCLETAIINTPDFFRLKYIRQLGGTYHVYPGATHTRFEHSLGVCYIAGKFVEHLNSKDLMLKKLNAKKDPINEEVPMPTKLISDEHEYCIRLAALCHDLGQGPVSRAFTDIAKEMFKDDDEEPDILSREDVSVLIFKKILLDYPVVLKRFVGFGLREEHVKMVGHMIVPPKGIKEPFLYEIVANKSSGVDVDKWDYLARDCHYLGIGHEFDWRRCMELSCVIPDDAGDKHIGFRDKQSGDILSMFRIRGDLFQKAYQHQAVNGIEKILKEALVKAKDVPLIDADKSMKDVVKKGCIKFKDDSVPDLSGYIRLNDNILYLISMSVVPKNGEVKDRDKKVEELKEAQELINRVIKRDLYALVHEEFYPLGDVPNEKKKPHLETLRKDFNEDPMKQLNEIEGDLKREEVEDLEIDLVTMRMASEKKDNPIEVVHFFDKTFEQKEEEINMDTDETAENYHKVKKEDLEISHLNLPSSFVEYRLRLYLKKKDKANRKKIKKLFKKWIEKNPVPDLSDDSQP